MCVITQHANQQSEDPLIMTSVAYSFMSMDSKNRHCEDTQSITAVPSASTVTTSQCTRGNYDCNGPQYPKLIKRRSKKISSVYIATTKEKVCQWHASARTLTSSTRTQAREHTHTHTHTHTKRHTDIHTRYTHKQGNASTQLHIPSCSW